MSRFMAELRKNVSFIHSLAPSYLPVALSIMILRRIEPFVPIILGAKIIDMLAGKAEFRDIIRPVIVMVLIIFTIELASRILDFFGQIGWQLIYDRIKVRFSEKTMKMDYEILERNSTLEKVARARASADAEGGLPSYLMKVVILIGSFVSIAIAFVTLLGLLGGGKSVDNGAVGTFFSSWISTVVMFLLMGISVFLNSKNQNKIGKLNYETDKKNVHFSRIHGYFLYNLILQYTIGKDIRIFHMRDLIEEKGIVARREIENVKEENVRAVLKIRFFNSVIENGFILLAYIFVGVKAILGLVTIGELSKYVSTIFLLQTSVAAIFITIEKIKTQNVYLKDCVELMEVETGKYEGIQPVTKPQNSGYELEFKNVSFHYPNSDLLILKNISFCLKAGSKISIVGPNGAGKTTFIKLLCRLYDPTEGEILLNGMNIKQYNYDEYIRLFSVVFQDFSIFSFSVAENVAASPVFHEQKVIECLEKAGFYERVKALPQGIYTKLLKDQTEDGEEGVEISGGEKQKLALARALYRDAPLVILDEPTSALDPLAEQDIYFKFNEMVKEKTAVFISHRMSSCRFCERVLVFDDGRIIQEGNHEELVKDTEGLYYEMWNAQAQYYVNE